MNNKILVVDDDQGILDAFRAILESCDYNVVTHSNPHNLTKTITKVAPSLIILDVLLSGADGREICRKLKSSPLTKDIPVIMVSAHPSAGKDIKLSGADDFLEKPFEMETLLKKVEKHMNHAKLNP